MLNLNEEAEERDEAAKQRDGAAAQRDAKGDRRDREAGQRDLVADQRDEAGGLRDQDASLRDEAAQRMLLDAAPVDGMLEAQEEAAADRLTASEDRQAAAVERAQASLDRSIASADRHVASSARLTSGDDRARSIGDRAAAARYRRFATQLASSVRFGWTVRQLEPPELLFASPGFLRLLGQDANDPNLTLAGFVAMIHPDDLERVRTDLWDPSQAGRPATVDLRVTGSSGDPRWLRVASNPVPGREGSPARAADTIEDISDRKALEAAVAAKQEAQRADTAKNQFLARMSHELRTPLNAVLGFGQLLELDELAEPQAEAVRHILSGGQHLLQLIEEVLDISRIEADDFAVMVESVQVSDLLVEVIGLMRPLADAAGIAICFDPTHPDCARSVLADRRRLRQVLINVLSNAIKYNQAAGRVMIKARIAPDYRMRVTVADTGIGVDPADLARLFVPFDRLGQEATAIEGTGLGLALSRRLMEIMGGSIDATSEPGHGTSFTIDISLDTTVHPEQPPATLAAASERAR